MTTLLWIAVLTAAVTSVGLLITRDWRTSIVLLAVQYLAMFLLTLYHWPLGMASVKVVSGWMSSAILGMTRSGLPNDDTDEESIWPRGRLFRLFAAAIVAMLVAGATPGVDSIMADAGYAVTGGSLLLMGMGVLHLGISSRIFNVTIGLMTALAGFEILYSTVEGSVLVAALLAMINLGLALAGSYLLIASNSKELGTE